MTTGLLEQWGPSSTPQSVRLLIITTTLVSVVAALADGLFTHITGLPGIEWLLSLSFWGMVHGFIWQPFTYFLVSPTHGTGLSLGMIFALLMQMYLLWIAGTSLVERVGPAPFLRLYISSGVLAGLTAIVIMAISGSHVSLAGAGTPLLAILVVWAMIYPEMELLLFFTIPVKIMWLVFGYLVIILLVDISQLNVIDFTVNFISAITAYLYATLAWDLRSPFPFLHPMDTRLNSWGAAARRSIRSRWSSPASHSTSKIVPINGKQSSSSDDEFLEAMLTKISEHGETSLSWLERHRLNRISKSKRPK